MTAAAARATNAPATLTAVAADRLDVALRLKCTTPPDCVAEFDAAAPQDARDLNGTAPEHQQTEGGRVSAPAALPMQHRRWNSDTNLPAGVASSCRTSTLSHALPAAQQCPTTATARISTPLSPTSPLVAATAAVRRRNSSGSRLLSRSHSQLPRASAALPDFSHVQSVVSRNIRRQRQQDRQHRRAVLTSPTTTLPSAAAAADPSVDVSPAASTPGDLLQRERQELAAQRSRYEQLHSRYVELAARFAAAETFIDRMRFERPADAASCADLAGGRLRRGVSASLTGHYPTLADRGRSQSLRSVSALDDDTSGLCVPDTSTMLCQSACDIVDGATCHEPPASQPSVCVSCGRCDVIGRLHHAQHHHSSALDLNTTQPTTSSSESPGKTATKDAATDPLAPKTAIVVSRGTSMRNSDTFAVENVQQQQQYEPRCSKTELHRYHTPCQHDISTCHLSPPHSVHSDVISDDGAGSDTTLSPLRKVQLWRINNTGDATTAMSRAGHKIDAVKQQRPDRVREETAGASCCSSLCSVADKVDKHQPPPPPRHHRQQRLHQITDVVHCLQREVHCLRRLLCSSSDTGGGGSGSVASFSWPAAARRRVTGPLRAVVPLLPDKLTAACLSPPPPPPLTNTAVTRSWDIARPPITATSSGAMRQARSAVSGDICDSGVESTACIGGVMPVCQHQQETSLIVAADISRRLRHKSSQLVLHATNVACCSSTIDGAAVVAESTRTRKH